MNEPGPRRRPPPPAVGRDMAIVRTLARDAFGREIPDTAAADPNAPAPGQGSAGPAAPKRELASDAIGRRTGALSDEIDFPAFIASLVHGTFDAIVDTSIRQMQSFAELVAAVAKPLEQFTEENVTPNQARDFLVEKYPQDVALNKDGGTPTLVPIARAAAADGSGAEPPAWLAEFGIDSQELTAELLETEILANAREKVARQRMQTLSTMVLLSMNRVVVKDGTINARVRMRAQAADHSKFDYATGGDPQNSGSQWGARGSTTYDAPSLKVSTVGVNVQSDSDIKADLSGEVKINFASETVPLDRFIDDAKRGQLERHSRGPQRSAAVPPPASAVSAETSAPTPLSPPGLSQPSTGAPR